MSLPTYRYYLVIRDGQILAERDNFEQARLYCLDIHDLHSSDCFKNCGGHYDEVYGANNLTETLTHGLFQLKPKDRAVKDSLGRPTGKVRGWNYYKGKFFDEE